MENISHLTVVAFHMPPFVSIIRDNENNISFKGMLVDLLFPMLRKLNISVTLMESSDPSHGVVLPDGNLTGTLKIFHEQMADITPIPYGFTEKRFRYMDFSTPFYYAIYKTMSGAPKGFTKNEVSFFDIFHIEVWLVLAFCMITVPILIALISKYREDFKSQNGWTSYLFFLFASITRQEIPVGCYANNFKRQLMVAFWLLGTFCLTSGFTGVLLSSLTIKEKPDRIDSVEDVIKYPNIIPFVLRDSMEVMHIRGSTNSRTKAFWNQIVKNKGENFYFDIYTPENLLKTSKGQSVILGDVSVLRRSLSYGCLPGSQFYLSKNAHHYSAIGFGMRKGLPYWFKKYMTRTLTMYATSMQLQHIIWFSTVGAEKCLVTKDDSSQEENEQSLSLDNFKLLFLCWAFGQGLAIVTFLLELSFYRKDDRYN